MLLLKIFLMKPKQMEHELTLSERYHSVNNLAETIIKPPLVPHSKKLQIEKIHTFEIYM